MTKKDFMYPWGITIGILIGHFAKPHFLWAILGILIGAIGATWLNHEGKMK